AVDAHQVPRANEVGVLFQNLASDIRIHLVGVIARTGPKLETAKSGSRVGFGPVSSSIPHTQSAQTTTLWRGRITGWIPAPSSFALLLPPASR
ncbi:MAG TPA: hypothetical protein VGJ84_17915, partial [Polyangiaceae bacterium]